MEHYFYSIYLNRSIPLIKGNRFTLSCTFSHVIKRKIKDGYKFIDDNLDFTNYFESDLLTVILIDETEKLIYPIGEEPEYDYILSSLNYFENKPENPFKPVFQRNPHK